ncbi:adenosine receptor A1-like [Liolophura sinensis]|uniref:adenosine receptor A1-like n=1 Tax=Liolophura sinensis TaxID=3198878 RepID=UPI003158904B
MALVLNVSDQCPGDQEDVIFWSLDCYGVTISVLIINFVTILVGLIIIFLNSVVITAVVRRTNRDDTTDIVIASLALADVILGMFVIYQTAYNVGNWQVFEECMVRYGILLAANLSSVLHMAFLTVDCYIKIARPYLYQRMMKRGWVITVSCILWFLSLIWGCLPVMGWNPGKSTDQMPVCGFFIITAPNYRLVMWFLFMIPLLKNILVYSHIFRIARRHATSISHQIGSEVSRKTWRFTKTVVLVIGFYFLCWTPTGMSVLTQTNCVAYQQSIGTVIQTPLLFVIKCGEWYIIADLQTTGESLTVVNFANLLAGVFLLIEYCGYLDHIHPSEKGSLIVYVTILGYINSLLNPLIYAVKIPYIKRRFAEMFGRVLCCRCFRQVSPEDSQNTVWQNSSSINVRQAEAQAEESLPSRPAKVKAEEC